MSNLISEVALFRLSVLGPLASRQKLEHGELKSIVQELAQGAYRIPHSKRVHLSPQTIEQWYYAWQGSGIAGLEPKTRSDKKQTKALNPEIQAAILKAKQDNPARSINTVISLLKHQGEVMEVELSRSTVHRFLRHHDLSRQTKAESTLIERRSFEAEHAGDIWQGDVLHGPDVMTPHGICKSYLVSLLDDASRLICHAAFCLGETALDIEGVLKDALLKRGVPTKLIIDNGAAYRAHSLQSICAQLKIRLVYSRPYEPQSKGKIERYHRTFREHFLGEINLAGRLSLEDLNARLWVWIEAVYHQSAHEGLNGSTPLARWRQDLSLIQPLGERGSRVDSLFYHRMTRRVRKDGTVSFQGEFFEVPYELAGQQVVLVFDPHRKKTVGIENAEGDSLGGITPLDKNANLRRSRKRPSLATSQGNGSVKNAVELVYQEFTTHFKPTTQE